MLTGSAGHYPYHNGKHLFMVVAQRRGQKLLTAYIANPKMWDRLKNEGRASIAKHPRALRVVDAVLGNTTSAAYIEAFTQLLEAGQQLCPLDTSVHLILAMHGSSLFCHRAAGWLKQHRQQGLWSRYGRFGGGCSYSWEYEWLVALDRQSRSKRPIREQDCIHLDWLAVRAALEDTGPMRAIEEIDGGRN